MKEWNNENDNEMKWKWRERRRNDNGNERKAWESMKMNEMKDEENDNNE